MSGLEIPTAFVVLQCAVTTVAALVSLVFNVSRLFKKAPQPCNDTLRQIKETIELERQARLASERKEEKEPVANERQAEAESDASRRKMAADRTAQEQAASSQCQAEQERAAAFARKAREEINASECKAEEERAAGQRLAEAERAAASARKAREELNASKRKAEEERVAAQRLAETALDRAASRKAREELVVSKRRAEEERAAAQRLKETEREELGASKRRAEEERAAARRPKEKEHDRAAARKAREELIMSKRREEEERAAAQRLEETKRAAAERQAKSDRNACEHHEQETLRKARDAKNAFHYGIKPVRLPTEVQVKAAMDRIDYDPQKLHFAVSGASGSGKSSLVNAFRGLTAKDSGAAAVGVTETTSKITRYPDPREDYPFSRFVWYDIPGAGTLSVPPWQYFNDQGLFVFDFIVLVYDTRFTTIDDALIENCYRFEVPVFIVRSKANQHIRNMVMQEDNLDYIDAGYEQSYEEKTTKYCTTTRSDFSRQIEIMKDRSQQRERELDKSGPKYVKEIDFEASYRERLSTQRVYIVSDRTLQVLMGKDPKKKKEVKSSEIVDELYLFEDFLKAATLRRYKGT